MECSAAFAARKDAILSSGEKHESFSKLECGDSLAFVPQAKAIKSKSLKAQYQYVAAKLLHNTNKR